MADPRDPNRASEAPPEGMMDLDEYDRLHPEEEDAGQEVEDPDALPTVSAQRLAELKQKARDMIEERLRNKRKQRRLMRGGRA